MSRAAPSTHRPLVVFTDLDGTLLDARTYSAAPAREALALLRDRGAVVVFCSSKTAAEQRAIRTELGLTDSPLIVENGSAVIVPASAALAVPDWPADPHAASERVCILGRSAAEVRAAIVRAAASIGLSLTGYADLSTNELAALTGLDATAAERAKMRDYSETLVDRLSAKNWAVLDAALFAEGLYCRHGGSFRTVTCATVDKGRAVRLLADLYAAKAGRAVLTAGLGDSANDESLLAAVDRAYLLSKSDGTWEPMALRRLRRIPQAGPRGWQDAILDLLSAT